MYHLLLPYQPLIHLLQMEDVSIRQQAHLITNFELTETNRTLQLGGKPSWLIAIIQWWSPELVKVWRGFLWWQWWGERTVHSFFFFLVLLVTYMWLAVRFFVWYGHQRSSD